VSHLTKLASDAKDALRGIKVFSQDSRPVQKTEYSAALDLDIEKVELRLNPRAQQVLNLNTDDVTLRQELSRLVAMIKQDVARSGLTSTGMNPQ